MAEHWLDINDLPEEGREFTLDDQALWADGWREFHMDISPARPLSATFRVTPQGRGVLVSGALTGSVSVPCDRCTAPTELPIDQRFDQFEEEPQKGEDSLEQSLLRRDFGRLELDAGSLLWEEFLLALPVKPLCTEECKGLCPNCGKDLNAGPCACAQTGQDQRFAALQNLVLDRKKGS